MDPRKLLQRLMDAAHLNPHSLSDRTGGKTKQPQIYRFLVGETLEPKRSTLEPVAKFFGVSVEAFFNPGAADKVWAERFAGTAQEPPPRPYCVDPQHPSEGADTGGMVAHGMSVSPFDHVPTYTLGANMDWETLPPTFEAAMPDDALAPDYPRGLVFVWSKTKQAGAGSVVLLRDMHGQPQVREYRRGLAPGQWAAAAINRAYPSFDDQSATIVATASFRGMP